MKANSFNNYNVFEDIFDVYEPFDGLECNESEEMHNSTNSLATEGEYENQYKTQIEYECEHEYSDILETTVFEQHLLLDELAEEINQLKEENPIKWTDAEHREFLESLETYNRWEHKEIAQLIKTKNSKEISSHSEKFFSKVERNIKKMRLEKQSLEQQIDLLSKNYGLGEKACTALIYKIK